MPSKCRSCGAPVKWAETLATLKKPGKRIPLDTDSKNPARAGRFSDGNIIHTGTYTGDGTPIVRIVTPGPNQARAHFSSCPHRDQHRRPR